jgi:hypothetical protein
MRPERLPEDHYHEAIAFLTGVFPRSQDAPIANRELRHWKYYAAHPFAKESRCYVFRDEEGLTAHAGFSPVQYATADGIRTSFQVIDWAGAPRRPGAGFLLFQALWKEADSHLGVGGSNDAVRLMRRIPTLRKVDQMVHCAYPLRPWKLLLESPWSWKSPLKLARSGKWHLARRRFNLDKWKATPVERVSETDASLLVPATDGSYSPLRRVPELLNYWLECPVAKVGAWRLEYAGAAAGFLVLAFLRSEVRIVDLVISTPSAPLAEAFALAIDLAAQDREACEVSGASSAAPVIHAMVDAGMIPRGTSEIFLGDPGRVFPRKQPIEVNLTIGDGFYLQATPPSFLSF